MTDPIQIQAVELLKKRIEEKVQWSKSDQWSNYDFAKLADMIMEATGVMLSVSTLKRVFGRVNYNSVPSLTTLNTLSQFAGYEDWRGFSNFQISKSPDPGTISIDPEPGQPAETVKKKKRIVLKLVLPVAAIVLLGLIVGNHYNSKQKYDPSDFRFSSKTILTEGLPNSVVFDYDASKANDKDSVFIAQSWDISRKVLVNKNNTHHSAIYYYPGYFRAKLMISDEIIQEHDIQIRTDGWLGLIEADWGKEPLYFTKQELVKNDEIVVDDTLLKKYNINPMPQPPPVRLFNQKDIENISTDNFTFNTEVKINFSGGANTCQQTEILLQAKNDILILPLSNPACVGDMHLAAYGFYTDSGKDDLSGFGCKPGEWTSVKIECRNRHIIFFINDKKAYSADIKNPPSEIVGVQYRFKGGGSVRHANLTGTDNRIIVF
ncbi:MAG: hypothetical protein IT249_17685 [Chitinophagaceae bacterium]|nr:hypothetical protein [Chitinophagaceae bacterium]